MTVVDDIKAKLDIVELVTRYVPLQASGANFKSRCPFHNEKTPSFYVFPGRQSWRCFGACATGGDVFNFYMQREGVDFSQALQDLARDTGTELQARTSMAKDDPLFSLMDAACRFFARNLASAQGAAAREYIASRGLTQETVEKFRMGLSPGDGFSLRRHLLSLGYTENQLTLSGLMSQATSANNGVVQDLFRHRLIIPIWDAQGRMVGFGGRAMDKDAMPKYLNSRQGQVFDKGKILYAYHMARDAIKASGVAVVVEGYMDAIVAHQAGFANVVASMGTALTAHQTQLLKRHAKEVVMALDSDAAGQEAILRSVETSWKALQRQPVAQSARGDTVFRRPQGPELKVAPLPTGKDPDEIILEDPAQWERFTKDTVSLLEFLFTALSRRFNLDTAQGKSQMAEALLPLVAAVPDPFEQDRHFRNLSELLGVSAAMLEASMGRPRGRRTPPQRSPRPTGQGAGAGATAFQRLDRDPLEEYALALLLQHPELEGFGSELVAEQFLRVENREVFTNWLHGIKIEMLDQGISDHLSYLTKKVLPPSEHREKEAALAHCIQRLQERRLRQLKVEEGLRLSDMSPEEIDQHSEEILSINNHMEAIFRSRSVR